MLLLHSGWWSEYYIDRERGRGGERERQRKKFSLYLPIQDSA